MVHRIPNNRQKPMLNFSKKRYLNYYNFSKSKGNKFGSLGSNGKVNSVSDFNENSFEKLESRDKFKI